MLMRISCSPAWQSSCVQYCPYHRSHSLNARKGRGVRGGAPTEEHDKTIPRVWTAVGLHAAVVVVFVPFLTSHVQRTCCMISTGVVDVTGSDVRSKQVIEDTNVVIDALKWFAVGIREEALCFKRPCQLLGAMDMLGTALCSMTWTSVALT